MININVAETIRRDFEEAPAAWRERPAHFHVWLARKLARLTQKELAA